jgi:hypothetical protein
MTSRNKKEDIAGIDPSKFAVEIWEIEKILPYENNAKIHTEEQVGRIAESIRRFGWQSVITVNEEGVIIAGHGRRLAAIKLGLKKIPVRVARGLSYEEERALRIADNKVSEAEHDVNILNKELKELTELEFDLTGLLDDRELKFLTEDLGFVDINAITPDLTSDVRHQSESTSQKIEEVDEGEMSLSKIFGASNIKATDGRKLQLFQAYIEGVTGKQGVNAMLAYAERVMSETETQDDN